MLRLCLLAAAGSATTADALQLNRVYVSRDPSTRAAGTSTDGDASRTDGPESELSESEKHEFMQFLVNIKKRENSVMSEIELAHHLMEVFLMFGTDFRLLTPAGIFLMIMYAVCKVMIDVNIDIGRKKIYEFKFKKKF